LTIYMKDLDYTYYDTWFRRECNMLYNTYEEYLNSEWWASIKLKALKRNAYKRCQFCDSTDNIHLHHTSYKWINTPKELCVIVPLCKQHHQEVHEYAKLNKVSVRIATNTLRRKYKPDWIKK
jgi:hypothetical protein